MSNGLALPEGIAQEQQRRHIIQQNFAICAAQIFQNLATEDYRQAIAELKQRQAEAKLNGWERPTNLVINPAGVGDIALAYAAHFALDALPRAMAQTFSPQ